LVDEYSQKLILIFFDNLLFMKMPFIVLFLLFYTQAFTQLRLSAFFSDHMILQRDKPVKIWGGAKVGDVVNLSIGTISGSATADKNGHWLITLPAFAAGGPYTISVKTKNESKVFTDVLFGEVWLCSGQSNMQFRVREAVNAKYEMHRANNPLIRQVEVHQKLSFHPEPFIDSTEWVISTPQTTGEFTAVGYFFARDIYERLHVPVGLIHDNWGGSQVESWISKNDMMGSGDLKEYASQMPDNWDQSNANKEKKLSDSLYILNHGQMPDAMEEDILKPGYSLSGWMPTSAPGDLDWNGLPSYRGEAYMVKEIWVDSIQAALPSTLSLGTDDIRFSFFLNGKPLSFSADKNILIPLPAGSWKPGINILLVKIGNQSLPDRMPMGIHGNKDQVYVDFEGERISLANDKWKVMPVLKNPHHYRQWMNNEGTIIYNAMLHPLIPLGIRGVLWYQGESNTDRAVEYGRTFPLMIESWRKEWKDDFPFLFVQLASFGKYEPLSAGCKWAELRESQSKTLSLPKTGMAVTTDVGDSSDIHPKNKQDVGRRLAAIALNDVYGFPQTHSGPVYKSVSFSNGQAILSFTSIEKGLMAKNMYGNLAGFIIAGPDRKFYYAHAVIRGDEVLVYADSVSNPVAVRYGWTNSPVDINLYNVEGFPASPFRTDNWPGLTESVGFYKR
jgi:sialate O-acetylesterase